MAHLTPRRCDGHHQMSPWNFRRCTGPWRRNLSLAEQGRDLTCVHLRLHGALRLRSTLRALIDNLVQPRLRVERLNFVDVHLYFAAGADCDRQLSWAMAKSCVHGDERITALVARMAEAQMPAQGSVCAPGWPKASAEFPVRPPAPSRYRSPSAADRPRVGL
jgi:hypothetical protein